MTVAVRFDVDEARLSAELATAVLRDGYRGEPPLLASVVAAGFADRLVALRGDDGTHDAFGDRTLDRAPAARRRNARRAVAARDARGALVLWVDELCERYCPPEAVTTMLDRATSIARRVVRAHHGAEISDNDFAVVESGIGEVLARHLQRQLHYAELLVAEDIEIAMAGFLLKLDDADPASAEHSRAVGLWCKRIARKLDLNEEKSTFAARCGLLHDVGKTRTPKDILQAPRGLTKEEWVTMRAHTTDGAMMVEDVPLLRPFAPAVRWHHERLDGLGYPDKLPAEDIPLHVRIVTVADCFNAMIGRRPYRLPMAPSAALEQLIEHRGTQFDPAVVDAMIDVVEHND